MHALTDALQLRALVPELHRLCVAAGQAILPHFTQLKTLTITNKADATPVTQADLDANHVLEQGLSALPEAWPVLSEENWPIEFSERRLWTRYWLVDPLDGTREFLAGSDEFTVNIALVDHTRAVLGVIYQPVTGEFYWGGPALGAWLGTRLGATQPQRLRAAALNAQGQARATPLRVIGSKRHGMAELEQWWQRLRAVYPATRVARGSSLKFCTLAAGGADIYPRFGPTSEWDTAAGQALLEGAGGCVLTRSGAPLTYNGKDSILNPDFFALGAGADAFWAQGLGF